MIKCLELTFGYEPSNPILVRFDHGFEAGTTTAIVGPSGSGKSTLLYLCGLLLEPSSGSVVVDGYDQRQLDDAARSRVRASHVGFVFQDAMLDPSRTVLDNVVEGSLYAGLERAVAIRRARDLMESLGVGMQSDRRPGEVSGGQAQRVALCRALINDPDNLLADEPTGNLDDATGKLVLDLLFGAAAGGKTVVIATHDHLIADRADIVVAVES